MGYPPGGAKPEDVANHRHGRSAKTVLTDDGPLAIEVPRDREGTFEPRPIPTHARRFAVEVSPELISSVTDSFVAADTAWRPRPLESRYPVVFVDAVRVNIRDEATVRNQAVYWARAVLPKGTREVLGIWIEPTAGATFWMQVFTDRKGRGWTSASRSPMASRA